ncbi:MAG TPA: cytochrome C oxidase subunit IV family protein [Anaerolineae bacterium]|nr:cytochrome C oxidase subunit IV family protein [Anaerolineae bacterium]
MEHGPAATPHPTRDPGDFVAEEARIAKAQPNYIGVFIFLGILTAIEITITTLFTHTLGRIPILLFLTVAKGLLVVLYYMHLRFDSRLFSIFFGAGVFALALPFVLSILFLMNPPQLVSVRSTEGGGEGGPRPVRPTANPNAGPPITFNTDGNEFSYAPNTLTANSGQAINVVLKNVGSVEHTFVLASKPQSEDPQPWVTNDGKLIARAAPGASGRGGFIAPGPGTWIFYCNVPGHAPAGMVGTLTVQ